MNSLAEIVETLLWEDESTTLDFKQQAYRLATDEERGEFIKDLLAFANAFRRDDAYILLGVADIKGGRGTIIGVTEHLEDAHLQQIVNGKINRTLEFSYHAIAVDGKQVGVVQIPRQARPTYLTRNFGKLTAKTVYVRHGSSTSIATPDEVARMGAAQQPRALTYNPEITALQAILEHARFHDRVIRLWDHISRIPHHYVTVNPRPPEYETERRALHVRFGEEHDRFRQAMSSACDLLTHVPIEDADEPTVNAIIDSLRDVEQTVSTLAAATHDRYATELPMYVKDEAAAAADKLSDIVAQRLVALGDSDS